MIRLLQINSNITRGGATRIMHNIDTHLAHAGFTTQIATQGIVPASTNMLSIPKTNFYYPRNRWEKVIFPLCNAGKKLTGKIKGAGRLTQALYGIARPSSVIKNMRGIENFDNFTGTEAFFKALTPFPDIIHAHNLHGRYFDLRVLPALSNKVPFFITLHDEWMFTGHCACTLGCTKWQDGCHRCESLETYESLKRDTASQNLAQRKKIYEACKLHVITPSQWLMDRAKRSIFAPAIVSANVIYNGVDLSIFKPGDQKSARDRLQLPTDTHILLFVANQARTSPFRDYKTLENAFCRSRTTKKLMLLVVGESGKPIVKKTRETRFIDYVVTPKDLVTYYQAADLFTYATKADTFPICVIEALACGLPVVATNIGGIPEQIDGTNGFLYEQGDDVDLAKKITFLLKHDKLREEMVQHAIESARKKFDIKTQISKYIELYTKYARGKDV